MRWRSPKRSGTMSCLHILVILSYVYASYALDTPHNSPHGGDELSGPNSETIIHHPTASLSIAGDLKDVKLKASIAQLVRALQAPSSKDPLAERKPKLELDGKNPNIPHTPGVEGARKLYYGEESALPKPITISSQPISINTANKTGGKRSRSLLDILEGVKTIEGVRVPDDEHDKHYTWRNARVIKGFLVPNDKSPNPHKKRQVLITDPQSYLAAAAAAQVQGATTIIDNNLNARHLNGQQHQHQQPVQQYQHQQQQSTGNNGGQTSAYTYSQASQQGQQMYVIQDPNSNSYVQYSPVQSQLVGQLSSSPHSQVQSSQFSSRVGPDQGVSSSPHPSNINLQQQIAQAQAAVNAIQQLQQTQTAQSQPQPSNNKGSSQSQQSDQVQSPSVVSAQVVQAPQDFSSTNQQYIIQNQPQPGSAYQRSSHISFPQQQQQQAYQNQNQNSQFVIQPQTYISGPGGQAFTIPVPIPADQVQQSQSSHPQQQQRTDWYHHSQQPQPHHQSGKNHRQRAQPNIANRVMDALHINQKAFDRVDTATAVVPALASTGIFLGLSALAAGWYLSRGNREVGIVRRTGKPSVSSSNRVRRDVALPGSNNYPQEVDQATFFQSIIQQSLEKSQQQYEDQVEPVYQQQQSQQSAEPIYQSQEPERYRQNNKHSSSRPRPQSRDDDYYGGSASKAPSAPSRHYAQEKSGALTIGSSKNFAKVFIPALILGVSVISITALIFGWYITGANREIAFLEPASYSRKKRSLFGPTALSDGGWLQKTITAIHGGNPYDRMPLPTSKSLLPHPFMDRETSKNNDLEFKISNSGLTGVLAGGAIIAIVALGLANSLSTSSGDGALNRKLGARGNSHSPAFNLGNLNLNANPANSNALKHLRAPRSIYNNQLNDDEINNPGFLSTLLSSIEGAENNVFNKIKESKILWNEKSPCAKRILCEIMKEEDDTTIKSMEKQMATYLNMLPSTYGNSLKDSFGEIISSIYKRDCSIFTCSNNTNRTAHGLISSSGTQMR